MTAAWGVALARIRRVAGVVDSPADALLAVRMLGWAILLPALTHVLPLRSLVALMSRHVRTSRTDRDPLQERTIGDLARTAHRAVNLGMRDNCLERSLIAYRYLCAANADPVLVVGACAGDAGVEGHVWLTVDGIPVHDSPEVASRFTTVTVFGAHGRVGAAGQPSPQ